MVAFFVSMAYTSLLGRFCLLVCCDYGLIVNALYWLECLIFGQKVRYYEFLPSFSALKGSLAPNQAIMLRIVTKGLFVR